MSNETYERMTKEQWQINTIRRETGLIEHQCSHGIGHPNPGSALWLAEQYDDLTDLSVEDLSKGWMIHGCDGCCTDDSFPDYRDALVHAHTIIRNQQAIISSQSDMV